MGKLVTSWFTNHWKLKFFAVISAFVLWIFVNQSITATKTLVSVPIRLINIPKGKTVDGLMPNGNLNRGINLSITGSKDTMDKIEPTDLQIVLNASEAPDEWVVQINKNDIESLNPEINISRDIKQINHPELIIELDKISAAKISVHIRHPKGKPPKGYEYLGTWPKYLMHTVIGPKAVIQHLHTKGLQLTFDLSEISKNELDSLQTSQTGFYSDEVSFPVPDVWKKVNIPLLNRSLQTINDPNATDIRIDFLRKEYIMLNRKIPIRVFYPLKNIETINPKTYPLQLSEIIEGNNGVSALVTPLLAYEVSRLFVDIIRDHMEIVITADPDPETGLLPWSVEFIDPQLLEDRLVSYLYSRHKLSSVQNEEVVHFREEQWRYRFRNFMNKMTLYNSPNQKFELKAKLNQGYVVVAQREVENR